MAMTEEVLGIVGGLLVGFLIGRSRGGGGAGGGGFDGVFSEGSGLHGEYKIVLCVRTDLGMKKGKIAAQCGHATLGVYKEAVRFRPREVNAWEENAQPKIAVQIKSMNEARGLERAARSRGIPTYMVYDAGRTQISAGSMTVLAIGPARKDELDAITGKLKLL
uniref:peptidyl-tRNA hydrolase n=1 Tax=Rhodosorus marinus TaxID=101924 RepID=A0A7S2ZHR8_9RHOD|mmetsp:Transcript_19460/g.77648  ORF Transcript_19460/g.77648 Transcript_19460/m.77648 type:complete len:163 (+) Transcript_19460:88-576(+)